MENKTKLTVIDFDGTLVDSPMPDTGRELYLEKTGTPWPHKGWWGRKESLDLKVFDIPVIPSVIKEYETAKNDPETGVIMLTGRMFMLKDVVMTVLEKHGLEFDGYFFNEGGSTDEAKKNTLDVLLIRYPNIESVEMFDDRLAHISIFQEWGDRHIKTGRLKNFKINLVEIEGRDNTH